MGEIKYIYYEIKYIKGVVSTEPNIENENILLIKPKTNSFGIWGFENITERKSLSKPTYSIVNQYWVDLEKFYNNYSMVYSEQKRMVNIVLEKLKHKLRKEKIKRIIL